MILCGERPYKIGEGLLISHSHFLKTKQAFKVPARVPRMQSSGTKGSFQVALGHKPTFLFNLQMGV